MPTGLCILCLSNCKRLPIWLEKGETARRVRQRIGVVLDYAHGKGWRPTEAPMQALNQLMGGLKQPKGQNVVRL